MTLVEKARKGEIAIGLDCTPEQMLSICKVVWPECIANYLDLLQSHVFDFGVTCIQKSKHDEQWVQMYDHEKTSPIVSAKDFLKEIAAVQIQVVEGSIKKRGKKIGLKELAKMAFDAMPNQFYAHQLADKCRELDFTRKQSYIDTFMRKVRTLRQEGVINYTVIDQSSSLYEKRP